MDRESFCKLYCAEFKCSPAEFEAHLLRQCLHPRSAALANFIWRVNPGYFRTDLELIREVKDLTSLEEVKIETNNFRYHNPVRGILPGPLRLRLSGQRLVNLADTLFGRGVVIQPQKPL